jgi:hypothetical protein
MIFKLDDKIVADGTVLLFGIRFIRMDPGEEPTFAGSKIWTYVALKVGGRWYFTGTGRVPQDAGWGAVARWLDDERKEVAWVKVATGLEPLWERTEADDPPPSLHVVARGEGVLDLAPGEH